MLSTSIKSLKPYPLNLAAKLIFSFRSSIDEPYDYKSLCANKNDSVTPALSNKIDIKGNTAKSCDLIHPIKRLSY